MSSQPRELTAISRRSLFWDSAVQSVALTGHRHPLVWQRHQPYSRGFRSNLYGPAGPEFSTPGRNGDSLGPGEWEQDRLPDSLPREEHHKPVDAHTHTAGRGHPVFHGPQEVLVQ